MDLVDLPRVKAFLDQTGTTNDALLADLITAVSAQIERYIGRGIELKARTEIYDLEDYQSKVMLSTFPVTTLTSVTYDDTGVFSSGAVTGYTLNKAVGMLSLPVSYAEAYGALQVVYTAGMAADVDGLLNNGYGDIVEACMLQVAAVFKRRQNIEQTSVSDAAGGVGFTDLSMIPAAKAILDAYRSPSSI